MEFKPDEPTTETQGTASLHFKEDETSGTSDAKFGQENQTVNTDSQPVQNEWGQYDGWNNQNDEPYISNQSRMSKKEFYKQPSMKKIRGNINACGIITYICAAITFLANILLTQNLAGIVDVLLLLGLGLGIHIGKSRVCSVILLVYAGFNTIYMIVTTGRLGGYLILICGIYAVIETFKFQKAWSEYERTGKI